MNPGGPCHTTGREGDVEGRGQVKVNDSPSVASNPEINNQKSFNKVELFATCLHFHIHSYWKKKNKKKKQKCQSQTFEKQQQQTNKKKKKKEGDILTLNSFPPLLATFVIC